MHGATIKTVLPKLHLVGSLYNIDLNVFIHFITQHSIYPLMLKDEGSFLQQTISEYYKWTRNCTSQPK